MRRRFATLFAALLCVALSGGSVWSEERPLKIGVLTDMNGPLASIAGRGSVEAARLAIEDFGGSVVGRKIELIAADHGNKPDTAAVLARTWFDTEGVSAIFDAPNSAVALAVSTVAREKKKLVFVAGAATEALTGAQCTGYGLQWVFDTNSQSAAALPALVKQGSKRWYLLVSDFAYGHSMADAVQAQLPGLGGQVVGSVQIPTNTTDYSSFLLQALKAKPDLVAFLLVSGPDTTHALQEAQEFRLTDQGLKLWNPLVLINDVKGIGVDTMKGLEFVTSFYWDMDDKTRELSKRFAQRVDRVPNQINAGVYSAVYQYLTSVKRTESDDSDKVLADLRSRPIDDAFSRNGQLQLNGRLRHDLFLVRVKAPDAVKTDWDYYDVLETIPGKDAIRSADKSGCPLVRTQ